MEGILFYSISCIALVSALYMVVSKNPLYSILSLIVTFFSIAALYILLNAQFLGIVQIIVYAGAIMVLFLYILMMLNLSEKNESSKKSTFQLIGVFSAGTMFIGLLGAYKGIAIGSSSKVMTISEVGLTKNLGKLLFNEYVLPFELASILILAAIVGAVVIGKKDI